MSVGAATAWSKKARPPQAIAAARQRLDPEHNGVTHMATPLRAGASLMYMIISFIK